MEDLKTEKQLDGGASSPSANEARTSRALHVNATMQVVTALCDQHALGVSTIEPLQSGGTRIVLKTSDDAENLRRRMKGKLIAGPVVRSSLHVARQPVPFR